MKYFREETKYGVFTLNICSDNCLYLDGCTVLVKKKNNFHFSDAIRSHLFLQRNGMNVAFN